MGKGKQPSKRLTIGHVLADDASHLIEVKGQSAGLIRNKLRKLRQIGIDPWKGMPLARIKSLSQVPPEKQRAITRTYEVYDDLFRLPHVVYRPTIPKDPPAPKLLTEKQMARMSDAALTKYTVRLEKWIGEKQAHDQAISRLLSAQEFGGHKILDKNLRAAVIPVIAGDPHKARFGFDKQGRPILRDPQGAKRHVPFDHKALAKSPNKVLDAIIRKHGKDKRYQIVMSGREYVNWNLTADELKERVKSLMEKYRGRGARNYKNFLRGILVYKENSLQRSRRQKLLAEVMAAREKRRAEQVERSKEMKRARQRRHYFRKKYRDGGMIF